MISTVLNMIGPAQSDLENDAYIYLYITIIKIYIVHYTASYRDILNNKMKYIYKKTSAIRIYYIYIIDINYYSQVL